MKNLNLIFSFVIMIHSIFEMGFSAERICEGIFLSTDNSYFSENKHFLEDANKDTKMFISYLSSLLEKSIISTKDIKRFAANLENSVLTNPLEEIERLANSTNLIHWEYLEDLINNYELDKKALLKWALNIIKEEKLILANIETIQERSKSTFRKIEFYPLPTGKFLFKHNNSKKRTVKIRHAIEVMSTPVTQWQWVELMGSNPSRFRHSKDNVQTTINGETILFQPDYPVENFFWHESLIFANKLSEIHGLPPTYDLSKLKPNNSNKKLNPNSHDILSKIPILSPGSKYCQARGYRLPTLEEQQYLYCAAGTSNSKYYFGNKIKDLEKHAWFKDNSKNSTQAVAQLEPLKIGDGVFFDVHGNVSEYAWNKLSTTNRDGSLDRYLRCAQSDISYCSNPSECESGEILTIDPHITSYSIGIRLVRTLDETKR